MKKLVFLIMLVASPALADLDTSNRQTKCLTHIINANTETFLLGDTDGYFYSIPANSDQWMYLPPRVGHTQDMIIYDSSYATQATITTMSKVKEEYLLQVSYDGLGDPWLVYYVQLPDKMTSVMTGFTFGFMLGGIAWCVRVARKGGETSGQV